MSLKEASQKFESDFIKKVLAKAGGSKTRAAKMLGIHRNTLHNYLGTQSPKMHNK
jgi:transcriptional regulator with PAS, ATPase and Fis domain